MASETDGTVCGTSAQRRWPPRSIQWRIHFEQIPRTSTDEAGATRQWQERLRGLRKEYTRAKERLLRAPDGSVPEGVQLDEHGTTGDEAGAVRAPRTSLEFNNPLSLAEENPWHDHFAKLAILQQIQMDVQRAFPDDPRMRGARKEGQDVGHDNRFNTHLAAVLAVWSMRAENSHIGYRQGMHELAAICWLVVKEDAEELATQALPSGPADAALFSRCHVEADAFGLFDALMLRTRSFYAWKETTKVSMARYTVKGSFIACSSSRFYSIPRPSRPSWPRTMPT